MQQSQDLTITLTNVLPPSNTEVTEGKGQPIKVEVEIQTPSSGMGWTKWAKFASTGSSKLKAVVTKHMGDSQLVDFQIPLKEQLLVVSCGVACLAELADDPFGKYAFCDAPCRLLSSLCFVSTQTGQPPASRCAGPPTDLPISGFHFINKACLV